MRERGREREEGERERGRRERGREGEREEGEREEGREGEGEEGEGEEGEREGGREGGRETRREERRKNYWACLPPHSCVHPDREATVAAALNIAKTIASKSPVAVQGSKVILNYSRDHSVDEGLEYVVSEVSTLVWNEISSLLLFSLSSPLPFPLLSPLLLPLSLLSPLLPLQLTWNSAMLQTEDIANAVQAAMTKEQPVFSKL